MRGRNREFQYLPAKIVGKIMKCQYLPSKIATFEIQKNRLKIRFGKVPFQAQFGNTKKIDSKYDLQKCHFRPNSEIQKKFDSKYKLDPILGGVWKFRFLYFFPPVCQIAHSSVFSDHHPVQDWALGVGWQPSGRQPSDWQAAACPGTYWLRVFPELAILWGSKLKGGLSFL